MARGTSTFGDLIRTTAGSNPEDLNDLWLEFQESLTLLNGRRSAFAALLSFPTTNPAETVPQTTSRDDMELASEYGQPVGIRISPDIARLGFTFDWYDICNSLHGPLLGRGDRC